MSSAAVSATGEQRFRLSLVSWEKYEQMAAWLDGRHVRLTYDRGELELRIVSHRHESHKHLLGALLMVAAEELGIENHAAGSMTFKREDLDRGLEPDECYWVEHEPHMRGKEDYDPQTGPPPDLVLEVEVSRSALGRMGIYAAMKIPEVWRWDGQQLRFCLLKKGKYVEGPASRSFPLLAASEIVRFVRMQPTHGKVAVLRAFRPWLREQQAQGRPAAPGKPSGSKRLEKGGGAA